MSRISKSFDKKERGVFVFIFVLALLLATSSLALAGNSVQADAPVGVDLYVNKSDGGITATTSQVVQYSLSYGNNGTVDATGAYLMETIPAGARFSMANSTPGWVGCVDGAPAGQNCYFSLGTVYTNTTGSVIFAVKVGYSNSIEQITNTATIGDDGNNGADIYPDDNTSTDTTPIVPALVHVNGITMVQQPNPNSYWVNITFQIVNQFGAPMDGLTFTGDITQHPDGTTGTYTRPTQFGGYAYRFSRSINSGTFTACAVNVTGLGVTYDAGSNVATCDSISVGAP
jgi:uncharacterized repeat protein (TIGR01451 family)